MDSLQIFPTQEKSFLFAEENNHKFFFAVDIADGGKKNYGSTTDFSSFYPLYMQQETKNFYELLKTDQPRLEYYDIDCPTTKSPEQIFLKFNSIYNRFISITFKDYSPVEWHITDSSRLGKVSLHLVNQNLVFDNQEATQLHYNRFEEFLKIYYPEEDNLFDKAVKTRNRCMRLIHSSKWGQKRPLEKAYWHESREYNDDKFIIQLVNPNAMRSSHLQLKKEVELKAPAENYCDEEFDLNFNQNKFLSYINHLAVERWEDYSTWRNLVWLMCKYNIPQDIILQYSSKANNYSKEATINLIKNKPNVISVGLGSLFYMLKHDMNPKDYSSLTRSFREYSKINRIFSLKTSPFINIIDIDDHIKWVQPLTFPTKCIAIKMRLGGGKTTSIINYINQGSHNSKIIILSPRITYAESICNEYNSRLNEEQESFVCYTNLKQKKTIRNLTRIVCSMESLHYFYTVRDEDKFIPDLLIIDECQANFVQHTCIDTNSINLENNITVFQEFIKDSKNIVMADAFLGQKTMNFINNMEIPTTLYNYKRKMEQRQMIRIEQKQGNTSSSGLECMLPFLVSSLEKNEKNFVFCSSKKRVFDWHQFLKRKFPNKTFIIYTGGAKIGDIKNEWRTADCIITTATITVGINFDEPNVFHNIFIHATARSHNLVSDIFQAHFRVRHIINKRLYFFLNGQINKILPTDYNVHEKTWNWKEKTLMKRHNTFETAPDYFKNLWFDNQYEQNLSSMMLEEMFKAYAEECNYTTEILDTKEPLDAVEIEFEPSSDEDIPFHDIKLLDEFGTQALIKKQRTNERLTEMEKLELDKKLFISCFSNDGIVFSEGPHVEYFWDIWRNYGRTKIRMLRREKKLLHGTLTVEQMYSKMASDISIAGIQKNKGLKVEFILKICKDLGLNHSHDTKTVIPNHVVHKLHEKMHEQEEDIRKVFELRDRKKEKTELSFTATVALLNSVFESYGYTSFKVLERKRKQINGVRVDISDYGLTTNKNFKNELNIEPDLLYEYMEMYNKDED
jgi:hypothetical protein